MSKEDNNNNINESSISFMLRSTGYLPALTEQELEIFDQIYRNYKFKLSNVSIDPDEIMEGSFQKKGKVVKLGQGFNETEIRNLSMAARKGQDIPKELMDKIKSKHKDVDNSDDK